MNVICDQKQLSILQKNHQQNFEIDQFLHPKVVNVTLTAPLQQNSV